MIKKNVSECVNVLKKQKNSTVIQHFQILVLSITFVWYPCTVNLRREKCKSVFFSFGITVVTLKVYVCEILVKNVIAFGHGQTVCDHTEWSSRRSTPPWLKAVWGGRGVIFFLLLFSLNFSSYVILDRSEVLFNRKCFMLVKIIALSFPTHKTGFVIWWWTYLLRLFLSCWRDGNSLISNLGFPLKQI